MIGGRRRWEGELKGVGERVGKGNVVKRRWGRVGVYPGGGVWDSDGRDLMSRAFIIAGFLVILPLLF